MGTQEVGEIEMARKVYILEGSIGGGLSETTIDKLATPSGVKRELLEVRVYTSQTSGVKVYLYKNVQFLCKISSEVNSALKLPYPVTEVLGPGDELRLTASNAGASASDVKVEVIVEETPA